MTPAYSILAGGQEVNAALRERLIRLTVRDSSGQQSDAAELVLDDRGAEIVLPDTGAELDIYLGYTGALGAMGRYVVDELEVEAPPRTLTIRAKAADMGDAAKAPRTRSWSELTVEGLVSQLAAEQGLAPRVSAELAQLPLGQVDQVEESDLHLLTRLAERLGAVAKPAGGALLFVLRGAQSTPTGAALPQIDIFAAQVTSWRATQADRGRYGAVIAHWHDLAAAQRQPVKVGSGTPVYTLRGTFQDVTAASRAAEAKLAALKRGAATLSLSLPGDPRLTAEARLNLTGFRLGVDGEWLCTQVEHTLDGQGYRCRVEGETPP